MHTTVIQERYNDPTLNIALDTLDKKKQALVFCNTRRGAASQAERIARKRKDVQKDQLAERILAAVSSPTKQCKRLASCVAKGVAFHHAGLHGKQRELIETKFRTGEIQIICCTPTLAMGLDMPAFRSVIRDLKRFSSGTSWGMADIPVLEYEQMSGRAGRPGMDDRGEAICIVKSDGEKEAVVEKYLLGDPEEIYSKLAVEPVLRTYVLSLISSGYVHDMGSLYAFFDETFYAFQYADTEKLHGILEKMVRLLSKWEFVTAAGVEDEFVAADELHVGALSATPLGVRVAELYLDPYTAHHLLDSLDKGKKRHLSLKEFPLLHLVCTTLEIRPLSKVRQAEYDSVDQLLVQHEDDLFVKPPGMYSYEYEDFLATVKTAAVLQAWISEEGEDVLLERFNVTPGELQMKRTNADWLLYSLVELAKLRKMHGLIADVERMRVRVSYGVKEDVLPLLRLKGIGRVRARTLFRNRIRTIADLKKAEFTSLAKLIGGKLAVSVKEQVGQKVKPADLAVKRKKRKGQVNLKDF